MEVLLLLVLAFIFLASAAEFLGAHNCMVLILLAILAWTIRSVARGRK